MLGLNRTEELKQTRENLKLQKEEAEKQKNNLSPRELRAEFIRKINQRKLMNFLVVHL